MQYIGKLCTDFVNWYEMEGTEGIGLVEEDDVEVEEVGQGFWDWSKDDEVMGWIKVMGCIRGWEEWLDKRGQNVCYVFMFFYFIIVLWQSVLVLYFRLKLSKNCMELRKGVLNLANLIVL